MTRHEIRLVEQLLDETRGLDRRQTVPRLVELGCLDRVACERRLIRAEVERLCRAGAGRCRALEQVARTCCCSYEKARDAFYRRN